MSSGTISKQANLTVIGNAALSSLIIAGGSSTVASGSSTPPFTASGLDVYGNIVSPNPAVSWSVVLPAGQGTGTIDLASGVLTG